MRTLLGKLALQSIAFAVFTGCGPGEPTPTPVPTPVPEARTFLQQLTEDGVIVKWRNGIPSRSEVYYGTDINNLNQQVQGVASGSHVEAQLSGLNGDTTYYYAFDANPGSADQRFTTAPSVGTVPGDGNIRVWIIGDSGTGNANALAVRDSYFAFNGNETAADVWLMLGDNAYNNGADADYQSAVFDVYGDILKRTAVWSTIGNHEMGSYGASTSSSMPSDTPYLDIFNFPTSAEAGGVSSGTEQYYSFNYGNVHFVCLDSQVTARDQSKLDTMKSWLVDDLTLNSADWTIVFFHHPPYSRGSHNSDSTLGQIDVPIFLMREQLTPIFDDYGVDLVYSGHSHSYERSFYVAGHTGLAATFDAVTHAEVDGANQPLTGQTGQEFAQLTQSGFDDKVVYTVAGSSGKVTTASLDHPVHFYGAAVLASVVLDINATTISAKALDDTGAVIDSYEMTRTP